MTYPLSVPMTPAEADELALSLAFTRTVRAEMVTGHFASPADRDRAAELVRAARMARFNAQS